MSSTDDLLWIIQESAGAVQVEANDHRTDYRSVHDALECLDAIGVEHYIPEEVRREMEKRNTMIEVRAYTISPIGCFVVYHYDLREALKKIRANIEEEKAVAQ